MVIISRQRATSKETVINMKKAVSTVTPKTIVKSSTNKIPLNTSNSDKPLARVSSKTIEKKLSDSTIVTTVQTKAVELTTPVKPSSVTFGKIPKLNPTQKSKQDEKPTPSASFTDQKLDIIASGGNIPVNMQKLSNISEKNLSNSSRLSPKHRSPFRQNRHQSNLIDSSSMSHSPMNLDDSLSHMIGKQPAASNTYTTSKYTRGNAIGLDNAQSQSPLSPVSIVSFVVVHMSRWILFLQGPSSTLYPPPSPPTPSSLLSSRPLSTNTINTTSTDTRHNPSHHSSLNFSKSSMNSHMTHLNPSSASRSMSSSIVNEHHDMWTAKKINDLWESASSDEDVDDDTNARRFFQQNMRAVDEELSKINDEHTTVPSTPMNSRTEQLLKRQKKAILCLSSNDEIEDENIVEPSASVDDFECIAMDIDSPKHRTQSESSEHTQTTIVSITSQNTSNGTGMCNTDR
jgi:hypothetical protein